MVFSLSCCDINHNNSTALEDTSLNDSNGEKESESTSTNIIDEQPSDEISDHVNIEFHSYADYMNFIETSSASGNLITYDELKIIGEFDSLIFISDAYLYDDYSDYLYLFNDSLGKTISLYIFQNPVNRANYYDFEISKSFLSKDLQCLNENVSGYIMIGGIRYNYSSGRLKSIEFRQGEYRFVVMNSSIEGDEYPDPEQHNTFYANLMKVESANNTINELLQNIGLDSLHENYSKCGAVNDLPIGIISNDILLNVGEFDSLYVFSDVAKNDYSNCQFNFIDEMDYRIGLIILKGKNNWIKYFDYQQVIIPDSEIIDDLRCLKTRYTGYRMIGDIRFNYFAGSLKSVEYIIGDTMFVIITSPGLDIYPVLDKQTTFISRLLTADKAEDCINSLFGNNQ